MKVLILDDDLLMAELLATILTGLCAPASVTLAGSLGAAKTAWQGGQFDLLICDWNLPDGSGLELVRLVRAADGKVPILMVTGRADRASVLTAAHYRINGFVTKPFSIEEIRERLQTLLPPDTVAARERLPLAQLLEEAVQGSLQLPTRLQPGEIVPLLAQQQRLSAQDLATRWQGQAGLITRLLDVANGSTFRRSGEAVNTLLDAVKVLGISMTLQQALALAFDATHALTEARLQQRAETVLSHSRAVAQTARTMAHSIGVAADAAYTAGLLSQVGELAVLTVLQRHLNGGESLEDLQVEDALTTWSQPYGNQLKVRWRMPIELRDLIGAVHHLAHDDTRKERIMMRAAALTARGQADTTECQRLLRRIGLDGADPTAPKPAPATVAAADPG
ncbi:HDOD domain-containing protein [Marinobacter sp. X15-166B]|uniref:HDOD domain-containing protein n=1 Tax=Marinobacter sp. X15-166B TaxID=1897620 RepID=UPI00085C3B8E|nr:HDOD domain-containing protein [Marinobacter sp. X15-166B]OEY65801.1 hypothetical protein BG841_04590 [Marinobacter sp. X15-166B]